MSLRSDNLDSVDELYTRDNLRQLVVAMEAPPAVFGGLADEVIEQISAKVRARQIAVADQISATILRTSGQSSEPLASSSQAAASPSIGHGLRPDRVPVEGSSAEHQAATP